MKSSEVPAWRPAIDALRRVAAAHTFTEFDLRNDRGTAEGVLSGLKARSVIVVAMGPLAAQLVRTSLPETPMVFAMVQEPAKLGLAAAPGVTGVAFAIPVKNQIAAFRLVNPRGVRIGVIYKEENSGRQVEEAVKAASLLRVALTPEGGGLRARDPGRPARAAGRGPGHRRAVDPDRPRAAGRRDTAFPALRDVQGGQAPSTAPPPGWSRKGRW